MSKKKTEEEIYEGIEAMVTLQITELGELVEKHKNSKTKTSKDLYERKIEKCRKKCLKYLFQLHKLDPEKVEEILGEAALEQELENADEIKEVK